MAIIGYRSYCLSLQGYSTLGDEAKAQIDLAQRFKPAICLAITLAALFTQSAPLTFAGAVLGYWAALFPYHPVDVLYRLVITPLFKAPGLGDDPPPRRFACGMAASLLLVGALGFQFGSDVVGFVFVGITALASLVLVVAGFCVGSFFYWLLVRRQIFRGN